MFFDDARETQNYEIVHIVHNKMWKNRNHEFLDNVGKQ